MGIACTAAVNLCIHCIGAMVGILPRESNKERRTVNNNSSRSWPFIRQNRDQMNIEKYSDPYKSLYTSLVHQKCRRKQSNQLTQPSTSPLLALVVPSLFDDELTMKSPPTQTRGTYSARGIFPWFHFLTVCRANNLSRYRCPSAIE